MALQGFDTDYYRGEILDYYQDIFPEMELTISDVDVYLQTTGMTAEQHFMHEGWQMGLSPNQYFDSDEYKMAWAISQDVSPAALDGINAYGHYLSYGAALDVNPSNDFDESLYLQSALDNLAHQNPAEGWDEVSTDDLRAFLSANNMTALSFHMDFDRDEQIATVTPVPQGEAVTVLDDFSTVSVDGGSLSSPLYLDADSENFKFIDDAQVFNNAVIANFTGDDIIEVKNALSSDYQFSNDGADVQISFNNEGVVNNIILAGVVSVDDIVYDQASLEAAMGFSGLTFA